MKTSSNSFSPTFYTCHIFLHRAACFPRAHQIGYSYLQWALHMIISRLSVSTSQRRTRPFVPTIPHQTLENSYFHIFDSLDQFFLVVLSPWCTKRAPKANYGNRIHRSKALLCRLNHAKPFTRKYLLLLLTESKSSGSVSGSLGMLRGDTPFSTIILAIASVSESFLCAIGCFTTRLQI